MSLHHHLSASIPQCPTGAYGTKHGAIFALPNIKIYDKVTIIKIVSMVHSFIETHGTSGAPRS